MPLTSEIRQNLDSIRDYLFGGGFPDPLSNAEQLSYLFYFNLMEYVDQNNALIDKQYKSIYDGKWSVKNPLNSKDNSHKIPKKNFKWSIWRSMSGPELVSFVRDEVFSFHEEIASKGVTNFMAGARLGIDEPVVLNQVISKIDELNLYKLDPDTKGDLFEFVLKQVKQAGELGQFRTPRHIIDFIVELIDPKIGETIYDPAAGTAGFLVSAYNYIRLKHSSEAGIIETKLEDERKIKRGIGDKLSRKEFQLLQKGTFFGNDVDARMIRLATMNLTLRGLTHVKIIKRNPLTQTIDKQFKFENKLPSEGYDVCIANPPFSGTIDISRIVDEVKVLNAKNTEILFVKYIINSLKEGGRCGVILPEGILYGTNRADIELRRQLIENNQLLSIISLPAGVFQPYAGVKTFILIFIKAKKTDFVQFIEIKNDGFKLDTNRSTPIHENDLPEAYKLFKDRKNCFNNWNTKKKNENWNYPYCIATKEELIQNNYNLHPTNYTPITEEKNLQQNSKEIIEEIDILEKKITKLIDKIKKQWN